MTMWPIFILLGVAHVVTNGFAFCLIPIHTRNAVKILRSSDQSRKWNDFLSDDENQQNEIPKLGIDIRLDPLTPSEASELKAEVSEMVSDKIAAGIDEIQKLRQNLARELEASQRALQLKSEMRAQEESTKLLSKIDQLTESFLSKTDATRASTKLAAVADRAMEGKGIEIGVWGNVGGAAVLLSRSEDVLLLGSVAAAQASSTTSSNLSQEERPANEKRILIVADTTQVRRVTCSFLLYGVCLSP